MDDLQSSYEAVIHAINSNGAKVSWNLCQYARIYPVQLIDMNVVSLLVQILRLHPQPHHEIVGVKMYRASEVAHR